MKRLDRIAQRIIYGAVIFGFIYFGAHILGYIVYSGRC